MNLKELLQKENKLRWLDVGCGSNFEEGFHYLDIFPSGILQPTIKRKYFCADILNLSEESVKSIGKFDLIRMQHSFEHLTLEEGQKCLDNCAKLMNDDAYILITTPDLRIHIQKYLNDGYKNWEDFNLWAHRRIPADAPNSFYFSIFTHSIPNEYHKWCYDNEGLIYQLKISGKFKNIMELKHSDTLASVPFTHNRPEEDVCVIANLK